MLRDENMSTNADFKSYHVGVAAEAFVAGMFARLGYDVSVQYGANQPEYDLIVTREDKIMKISVKGSKDGAWGLSGGYKKDHTYHEAADLWLSKHKRKTVMCFVQFDGIEWYQMPKMYLATPEEVAVQLKISNGGQGTTTLHENKIYTSRAKALGTTDAVPYNWTLTSERIEELFIQFS